MMVRGLVAAVLAFLMVQPAAAAIMLDQQSLSPYYPDKVAVFSLASVVPGDFVGTDKAVSTLSAVQTITAGQNGVLNSILFAVMGSPTAGNLKLTIIDGDYMTGSRTSVGSVVVPLSALPSDTPAHPAYSFDVSSLVYKVATGQKYSVLLETEYQTELFNGAWFGAGFADFIDNPDGTFSVGKIYSTGYEGGSLSALIDGTLEVDPYDYDLMFATYVDTNAVPEPSTWAMMILGFGIVGAGVRARKKPACAFIA